MNYRHVFHAGNFADVFKHVVLARILTYLARKPAPFRVIDTHAGEGSFNLSGAEAARTGEWRNGIGRLDPASLSAAARDLVQPYAALAVPALAQGRYAGSPALALAVMRAQDRALFCERQPDTCNRLRRTVGRDKRAKVIALDGYAGLNAFVPPVERRGLVLIDPPFEQEDEFETLRDALIAGHRKWRDGIFAAWMPLKMRAGVERLSASLREAAIPDILRLEFAIDRPASDGGLVATAMIVINAPYVLEAEMACVLPELAGQLGRDGRGTWSITRIAGETADAPEGRRRQ